MITDKEKQTLLDNLRQMPIIELACKKSSISRASFYNWKKNDKEFAKLAEEAISEGEDLITDLSENQLIALIRDRNFQAIQLWLKSHHKKYSDKLEISAILKPQEELDPEQEQIVRGAMRLAMMPEEQVKTVEQSNFMEIKNENGNENEKNIGDTNEKTDEKSTDANPPPELRIKTGIETCIVAEPGKPEPEFVYIKDKSELKEPITKPTILRNHNGMETIFLPRGEKLIKTANNKTVCYHSPFLGGERLVIQNKDGTFSIKPIPKQGKRGNDINADNRESDFQKLWTIGL